MNLSPGATGPLVSPGLVLLLVSWFLAPVTLAATPAAPASSSPSALSIRWSETQGTWAGELALGETAVGSADPDALAGIEFRTPASGAFRGVVFDRRPEGVSKDPGREFSELGPVHREGFVLRFEVEQLNPWLLRRTLVVSSATNTTARFAARWSLRLTPADDGQFSSFYRDESARVLYDTLGGGPEYPDIAGQTFPVALYRRGGSVVGIIADSPGRWENRCLVEVDPPGRRIAVLCGDGRDTRELRIRYDARDTYRYDYDGWQTLGPGETRRFDTWIFASPALTHYDAQLAAHLALANAKGWNGSAIEAILRNTAHFLLRRNLMRDNRGEGRYVFTSGIGYGWKQWVSDGFWQAVAMEDPELLAESHRSVFINRITYEDNAQYYLIWAALVKRTGREPNPQLIRDAYQFIRSHETNGVFFPPGGLNKDRPRGFKTYHDLLEYDDDDAPVSNQGFHCGALLAAKELGLPATTEDFTRAKDAYQRMFHAAGGYFPTSIKQTQHVGQDTLYGAALTYAVFGEKLLPDEAVRTHWRTSQNLATPFGLRVISKTDGSLLEGHKGEYVFGGSWFLNDSANHLMAGLHGIPATETDAALIRRLGAELAHVPAFHESISTVTGKPHGHILYSWNSGYWWLRKRFRERQGQSGPDPVETAIDERLGVIRDAHGLRLDPAKPTLRPAP